MRLTLLRLAKSRQGIPAAPDGRLNLRKKFDYDRTMPESYVKEIKQLKPHQTFENRFGAPPVKRFFGQMISQEKPSDDYVHVDDGIFSEQYYTEMHRKKGYYSGNWFNISQQPYRSKRFPSVKPIPDEEWTFFRGDIAVVMVGPDKGKTGRILEINRDRNLVKVELLHMKRVKKGNEMIPETWADEEQWLDVAKGQVKLADPNDLSPIDVTWVYDKEAKMFKRVYGSLDTPLPISVLAGFSYDFRVVDNYVESDKDTTVDAILSPDITFEEAELNRTPHGPSSFEQDIMRAVGIDEHRKYKRTYWY